MEPHRLSVNGLSKSFSIPVLSNVDLALARGEIRGLVGENGAGKTTLINILTGALQADQGDMHLDGVAYAPANPRAGISAGISCVTQELSIFDSLTVAENIFLKRFPASKSVVLRDRMINEARLALDRVGLQHLSPQTRAEGVGLADKQLLELAKALATECRLLLLDEPTSALTAQQANRLHQVVREVAASGTSVIYVSHRLQDVLDTTDSVTIMRDGLCVATGSSDSYSVVDIVEKMSGRNRRAEQYSRDSQLRKTPALVIDKIVTKNLPHPMSFTCNTGEIIGLAGLAGAGRSELLQAAFGIDSLVSGQVCCISDGEMMPIDSARRAVQQGVAFLGEDRKTMGLFRGQSVLSNITLAGLSSVASSFGLISRIRERSAGRDLVDKLSITCTGIDQDVDELSGGNQQKALLGRWLHCSSTTFLLDEPTRGIDVAAKNAIYDLLFEMRDNGKAIIIASSEIDELTMVCDRILVLSKRKLVREFLREAWSEADILAAAFSEFIPPARMTNSDLHRGTSVVQG